MNSIRLYTMLFLVEAIIVFMVLMCDNFITNNATSYGKELQFIILMSVWKLMLYYVPLIVAFIFLHKYFTSLSIGYISLLLSIFNVVIFIGLNFLYKVLDLPSLEINDFLFWVTCVAIAISPLVLWQIPYFKKLIESF